MAILAREDIVNRLMLGLEGNPQGLVIPGFDFVNDADTQRRIQANSIDCRVGGSYQRFRQDQGVITQRTPQRLTQIGQQHYERFVLGQGETFIVEPGEFVLVVIDLRIKLPADLCAYVEGKSTVGRSGVTVVNAGFAESGFGGDLTLECRNDAPFPIEIACGDDICQLVLVEATRETSMPYGHPLLGSRYQGQEGATAPRPARTPYSQPEIAQVGRGAR